VEFDRDGFHWHQDPDAGRAERALHQRAGLACQAATAAGVAGSFRTWEQGGVFAVLATDPALAFLSMVSGVRPPHMPGVLDLLRDPVWAGVTPTVTASADHAGEVGALLLSAGLVRGLDRALAVRQLDDAAVVESGSDVGVVDADDDARFVSVLLAGYEVDGPVAAYIAAEHSHPAVRRLLVINGGAPAGAAAMTMHGEVAVLGGASTLPQRRGRGVQSRLIEHRIRRATEAGCALAVATVRPDSVSESNLRRAGFRIHRCATWTKPPSGAGA
jgi:GNAT superfamily N-acetyltransferase